MSAPLSDEELAELRDRAHHERQPDDHPTRRVLATVDADRAKLGSVLVALRDIAVFDPEGWNSKGDLQGIARRALAEIGETDDI